MTMHLSLPPPPDTCMFGGINQPPSQSSPGDTGGPTDGRIGGSAGSQGVRHEIG